MNTASNLNRTPRTKRKTLKLLVTIEQPTGWTIPMVQTLLRNGIQNQLCGADGVMSTAEAMRICEAVRISLQQSITVYNAGGNDE